MLYGDEKSRQMARSLLPSKSREMARKMKGLVKRNARRAARGELRMLARDPEAYEVSPLEPWPEHEVRQLVRDRRGADKLGPFFRWAEAVTRELPAPSRLSRVRSLVPEGVIGEHALDHLRGHEAFEPPLEREHRQALTRLWWQRQRRRLLDRGEAAALLRELLTLPGLHRAFNRWLQRKHVTTTRTVKVLRADPVDGTQREVWTVVQVGPTVARKLLGSHDVLPFLDDLEQARQGLIQTWRGSTHPHPEWLEAADAFLRAFKAHGADLAAIERALASEGG